MFQPKIQHMTLRGLINDCIVEESEFTNAMLALDNASGCKPKQKGIRNAIAECREHNTRLKGYLTTIPNDRLNCVPTLEDEKLIGGADESKRTLLQTIRNLV